MKESTFTNVVAEGTTVEHPSYYNQGKIEVIDFIEDQGFGEGFCLGNALKYICRAGRKDPNKLHEDIQKAIWYLERYDRANTKK